MFDTCYVRLFTLEETSEIHLVQLPPQKSQLRSLQSAVKKL